MSIMRALAIKAMIASAVFISSGVAHAHAQTGTAVHLRAGDAVRVEIKDEPNFSGEFILGSDGELLLPTIGRVKVAARPFPDVEAELRRAYALELVEPVIRITPLVRISVLGEVRAPGLFLIDPTYTITDVIARAGGLMPTANANKITTRRADGVVVAQFRFGSPPMGTKLASGDEITVERRSWASEHLGILLSAGGSVAVALITSALIR
ncbi:MAG: polysaccharide biosynthesis/export family protein [Gemmatimonadota bacterium]